MDDKGDGDGNGNGNGNGNNNRVINDTPLRESFVLCQIMFFGLTLITVIEALRTPSVLARGIMNLESAVSLVAGYVYTVFGQMAQQPETTYADITRVRYYDWFVTTPMLLLTLVLFFSYATGSPVAFGRYGFLFALNFAMLYAGYLGEIGAVDRDLGGAAGFVFFAALIAFLFYGFVLGRGLDGFELGVFALFVVVWTCYGLVYYLRDIRLRNRIMNCLDVVAKIFIGLLFWVHVSGIARISSTRK